MPLFSPINKKELITPLSNLSLFADAVNRLPPMRREAALEQLETASASLERNAFLAVGVLIHIHTHYPRHQVGQLQEGDAVFKTIHSMGECLQRMLQRLPRDNADESNLGHISLAE